MPKKSIRIHNITYELNKSTLTENAKNTLDTTLFVYLQEHSDIIVEISSHTDNVGSDKYNQDLSEKRAETVVNYLFKKGIAKNRLKARGYGELRPIADNNTTEGRDKNRRTEFKIIGSVSESIEIINDN
jgi:outer membrane protein OmpA-like peptidoglycan-associated protein